MEDKMITNNDRGTYEVKALSTNTCKRIGSYRGIYRTKDLTSDRSTKSLSEKYF